MKKKLKDIKELDKVFAKGLGNATSTPPSAAWANIAAATSPASSSVVVGAKIISALKVIGVVATIASVSAIVWNITQDSEAVSSSTSGQEFQNFEQNSETEVVQDTNILVTSSEIITLSPSAKEPLPKSIHFSKETLQTEIKTKATEESLKIYTPTQESTNVAVEAQTVFKTTNPLSVTTSKKVFCKGEVIEVKEQDGKKCNWTLNGIDLGANTQLAIPATKVGPNNLLVQYNDQMKELHFEVEDMPNAEIIVNTLRDNEIELSLNKDLEGKICWFSDDNKIGNSLSVKTTISPSDAHIITAQISTKNCNNEIVKEISAKRRETEEGSVGIIPDVFTPNNDGANDTYLIEISNPKEFELLVFDAKGEIILFQTNDYTEGWNGKKLNKGYPLASGSYIAKLKYQLPQYQEVVNKTYIINLIRD